MPYDATAEAEKYLKEGYNPAPTPDVLPGVRPMNEQGNGSAALVKRYSSPAPTSNPLEDARAKLDALLAGNSTPDQNAIRENVRANMQTQIDATNKVYDELRRREELAGQGRDNQTRAINLRAGLGGSDFAASNAAETKSANDKAINAIEAERGLKLSALFDQIDERATKQYETETALAKANAEERVKLLAEIQQTATDNLTSIAKGGIALSKIKEDPAYAQLLQESGMSELEFDALYNQNLPKKEQKDIHYEKLGNDKVVAFWTNNDGTLHREEYQFDVPAEKNFRVIDGVPYYEDPKTQTLTPAKGYVPQSSGANLGGIDQNAPDYIDQVIKGSAGGKNPSVNERQSLSKSFNVLNQIEALQSAIKDEDTGPIWGAIRSKNPYDTKAQTIKAQLTAIVPNLARGVFGEVGVLTDNDVALYSKTLPNLQSTSDVRKAIEAITLRTVQRSIENQLEVMAASGLDVSGFAKKYNDVKATVTRLESDLGVSGEERVSVISPDGVVGDIPKSQLEQALKEGYKQK